MSSVICGFRFVGTLGKSISSQQEDILVSLAASSYVVSYDSEVPVADLLIYLCGLSSRVDTVFKSCAIQGDPADNPLDVIEGKQMSITELMFD